MSWVRLKPAFMRPAAHQLQAFVDQMSAGAISSQIEFELAGLRLGQIQNVVDQGQQMPARAMHVMGIFAVAGMAQRRRTFPCPALRKSR